MREFSVSEEETGALREELIAAARRIASGEAFSTLPGEEAGEYEALAALLLATQ